MLLDIKHNTPSPQFCSFPWSWHDLQRNLRWLSQKDAPSKHNNTRRPPPRSPPTGIIADINCAVLWRVLLFSPLQPSVFVWRSSDFSGYCVRATERGAGVGGGCRQPQYLGHTHRQSVERRSAWTNSHTKCNLSTCERDCMEPSAVDRSQSDALMWEVADKKTPHCLKDSRNTPAKEEKHSLHSVYRHTVFFCILQLPGGSWSCLNAAEKSSGGECRAACRSLITELTKINTWVWRRLLLTQWIDTVQVGRWRSERLSCCLLHVWICLDRKRHLKK